MTDTALAKTEERPVVAISEAATLLQVIERAATNPAVDIDKMERLLQMHERILDRKAEAAFNDSMAAVQAAMRHVAADANNKQTNSKYASYAALDKALRPIYTANGFSISFDTEPAEGESILVVASVSHCDGYTKKYRVPMPTDGKGAKGGDVMTRTHATGSAMTYGQRYLLKMAFNIAVGDDNDGGSSDAWTITEAQAETLQETVESVGADKVKFFAAFKIDAYAEMLGKDYDRAMSMLERKRAG